MVRRLLWLLIALAVLTSAAAALAKAKASGGGGEVKDIKTLQLEGAPRDVAIVRKGIKSVGISWKPPGSNDSKIAKGPYVMHFSSDNTFPPRNRKELFSEVFLC